LSAKRDKLSEQLSEARRLKANIDRRSEAAAATVGKYLGAQEEAEHRRFLIAKVRLIVDARDVQDRMQTAEEQMLALKQ
jgi:protein Shroom